MSDAVIAPVSSLLAAELERIYQGKQYAEVVSTSSSTYYETIKLHGSPQEYIRRTDMDGFVTWYASVF
jgi:hypothetical protein